MTSDATNSILAILGTLRKLEGAMARYYLSCSEAWGEQSAFWMGLAVEEEKHEKIIEDLSQIVRLHPEQFEEGLTIEPSAVESFIASIEEKISDVLGGKSSVDQALTFALNMEESILEGRFFETVRSSEAGFSQLVHVLADDLARHRQQIIDEQGRLVDR
jgi:hypothetical protein